MSVLNDYISGILTALNTEGLQPFKYAAVEAAQALNEMERSIRGLKTCYRRIIGRKTWNSYLLRYGRCVAYYDWWEQDAARQQQLVQHASRLDRATGDRCAARPKQHRANNSSAFAFDTSGRPILPPESRWAAVAPKLPLP
jgi:hypothetical protein